MEEEKLGLKKNERWSGEYDGVAYEIQRFEGFSDFKFSWTFYLWIALDKIPDLKIRKSLWLPPKKDDRGRVRYDYYKSSIFINVEWHGGMTYYSKENGHDGSPRTVKAGCDFQHSWDQGCDYSLNWVQREAIVAAKSFRVLVPEYQYWCRWNGALHGSDQVVIDDNGKAKCITMCDGEKSYRKNYPEKTEAAK